MQPTLIRISLIMVATVTVTVAASGTLARWGRRLSAESRVYGPGFQLVAP
jgi:hypothetical protein